MAFFYHARICSKFLPFILSIPVGGEPKRGKEKTVGNDRTYLTEAKELAYHEKSARKPYSESLFHLPSLVLPV
jgi:hypothetical protein